MSRRKKAKVKSVKRKNTKVGLWDELHLMHEHCSKMISGVSEMGVTLNNSKIGNENSELKEVNDNLIRTLNALKAELESIFNGHKEKTGAITSPDETMEGILYGEAYYEWMSNFETTVLPLSSKYQNILSNNKPAPVKEG